MRILLSSSITTLFIFLAGCQSSPISYQDKKVYQLDDVFLDNRFDGARINNAEKIAEDTYRVTILPENDPPINSSPWYSFKVYSKEKKNVVLTLKYHKDYYPRYIPKLSRNGKDWIAISGEDYTVDSLKKEAHLKLTLSPEPLWVNAQEAFPSKATYRWLDSLAVAHGRQIITIGKSVLDRNLVALEVNAQPATKKTLVFAARQHPPEITGGVLGFESFITTIMDDSPESVALRSKYNIILLPMINPDGIDLGHWRHNANGADLNRDWIEFTQPETQAVRDFILKKKTEGLEIMLGVDFHSSYTSYILMKDSLQTRPYNIVMPWLHHIHKTWPEHFTKLAKRKIRPASRPYMHNWFYNIGADGMTYEEADETPRSMIKYRGKQYAKSLTHILLHPSEK